MRKILLLFIIGVLFFPLASEAGIYGVIKGKVVDEDGNPVIGASVRIEGTKLGAVVKPDGNFTVVNISPGNYKVRITSVGYVTYETSIQISADEVSKLDARMKLSQQGATTETLYVDAKKIMVDNSEIGKKQKFDSEQLQGIAREGVQAIVGLSAGVFNSGTGYSVRGSRPSETQIRLDGLDIGNQFTGGLGAAGITYFPMISQFATEEVQVLTGGFSAEYGNAGGGIVNTVAKTGRLDRHEGFLRWRTDLAFLHGSQANGLKLVREGDHYKAIDYGDGYKLQGSGENKFEFGVGGPIPYLGKTSFYLSGNYFYEKYRNRSFKTYDPLGNNLGQLPDNQSWIKNLTWRLRNGLTDNIDLITGITYGMTNVEVSGWDWLYSNDPGTLDGVPERIAKQPVLNQMLLQFIARINHRLGQNSFYEFTISNTTNNEDWAKRATSGSPNFFTGYDLLYPQDKYKVVAGELKPLTKGENGDKVIDWFTPLSGQRYSSDGFLKSDFQKINPLTGYYEGGETSAGTNNAYGITGQFQPHGNDRTYSFRRSNYWQFDGNYNLVLDGEFQHQIKTGFETRFYQLRRHANSLPWDGNPFFDVYTDEWGGNLYADTVGSGYVWDKTSQPYNPWRTSVYVQDQITYKGIIISPGLRLDLFDPNSEYRTKSDSTFTPISKQSEFASTTVKYQISPRVNVTYPITERSNISLNYGLYFQMPDMNYLYDAFAVEQLRGNQNLGNPEMKAQRTNQYQVMYSNQLTDDFALDIAAYYKDMYNAVGMRYIPASPQPYYLYSVTEYGNAKGLEFTIRKRATDHIQFDINYNLSWANSTSPNADANYLRPVDPYTQKQSFPLSDYPTNDDRRHRINLNLVFFWGNNEGPSIAGIDLIENTSVSFTTFYQSGQPFTRQDRNGFALSEYNGERRPSLSSTDLRLSRNFYFRDWFGDKAGNSAIEIFVTVSNLFNYTGPVAYYARTGDPLDDGVNMYQTISNFSSVPYYKTGSFSRAESISPEQYDAWGERFYSKNADFNNNGIVTQEERYQSFYNFYEDALKRRGNFNYPRQVYFGFMFRF